MYNTLPNVVIPSQITFFGKIYIVTGISANAFSNGAGSGGGNDKLISIFIPASINNIGNQAFAQCRNLTNITVDPSNPYYYSDSFGVLYDKTKQNIIQFPIGNPNITSYTIIPGVTNIGIASFSACSYLRTLIFPNSLLNISEAAFRRDSGFPQSLVQFAIPGSVTFIGNNAFSGIDGDFTNAPLLFFITHFYTINVHYY